MFGHDSGQWFGQISREYFFLFINSNPFNYFTGDEEKDEAKRIVIGSLLSFEKDHLYISEAKTNKPKQNKTKKPNKKQTSKNKRIQKKKQETKNKNKKQKQKRKTKSKLEFLLVLEKKSLVLEKLRVKN